MTHRQIQRMAGRCWLCLTGKQLSFIWGVSMAAEKNFEEKVKRFLKDRGAWFIKYWGGGGFTKSGIPDLLVCYRGHFLGIELKGPRGQPSDLQLYHLRQIDQAGGYGILLYPKDYEMFQRFMDCLDSSKTMKTDLCERFPFLTGWQIKNH